MRLGFYILLLVSFFVCAQNTLLYLRNSDIIARAQKQYGDEGHKRIKSWLSFIDAVSYTHLTLPTSDLV